MKKEDFAVAIFIIVVLHLFYAMKRADVHVDRIKSAREGTVPFQKSTSNKKNGFILVSTWRSGSTFFYDIFNHHPQVYNVYEPLYSFGVRTFQKDEPISEKATSLVHDLLKCRYHDMLLLENEKYPLIKLFLLLNTKNSICRDEKRSHCLQMEHLQSLCRKYSWTGIKVVRLGMKLVKPMLEDEALNVHVVFLVRDPRAVMNSRKSRKFCTSNEFYCNNASALCNKQVEDFKFAKEYAALFPGRIHIVRYEDLSLSPHNVSRDLFSSMGLDFPQSVHEFIDSHTKNPSRNPFSTAKDSVNRIHHWVDEIGQTLLDKVQNACGESFRTFGYKFLESTSNFSKDNFQGILIDKFNYE